MHQQLHDASDGKIHINLKATRALHLAAEAYLEELFSTANRLPRSDKSVTLRKAHLTAAASLRGAVHVA